MLHTALQACMIPLYYFRRVGSGHQQWLGTLLKVFMKDVVGHSVEIERRIADIGAGNFRQLLGDSIKDLIGQFFGRSAASARVYLDEPEPDFLILPSGLFAVWRKPGQHAV